MFLRDLRSDFLSLFSDAHHAGWRDAPSWGHAAWWFQPLMVPALTFARGGRTSWRAEPATTDQPSVQTTAIVEAATIPTDPLFNDQWHLLNTGQTGGVAGMDVNVVDVWDDYTGAGVTIGVIDTGVQLNHPDLAAGMNTVLDYDALNGDNDPSASGSENHATAVSGMIVAQDSNGIGVSGVAHGAQVAGFRMGFGSGTLPQIVDNLSRQDNVDISSNSWAYNGYFYDNFEVSTFAGAEAAIIDAVSNGRGGLGTVFLFAGGNDRTAGQNVNYHSFQNSIYTIAVAAIEDDGTYASFSTPGAALLVTAPGDDVLTTDRTGGSGYTGSDYVEISGTSFSTPLTAGVVALMLEANPNLGYRDVQEILAYSARQNHPTSSGWEENGAMNWNGGGLHVSHDYGFGLVDAHAAVRFAETWTAVSTYHNEVTVQGFDAPNQSIPDGSGVLARSITLPDTVLIDQIEVILNVDHSWIGDLIVTITSPDGTESVLVNRPGKNPNSSSGYGTSQDDITAVLTSTHHWGETSGGTWTLRIYDVESAFTGRLINWTLVVHGDAIVDDDTYFFTDEFGGISGTNYLLGDSAGDDTLNAAAVTSNSTIDLDGNSIIAGNAFNTGNGIENAYGGDGDDTLTGNGGDNTLMGGRGDDDLFGEGGTDTAKYLGHSSGFTVVTNGATTTVTDINGADVDEGTDTLNGIEFIAFSDQTIAIASGPAVNLPPTDMALSNDEVAENSGNGTLVGVITTTDPDNPGETFTYNLTNNAGGRFDIDNNGNVTVDGALNAEAAGGASHQITVQVTDSDSNVYAESFTITVTDVNEAPVSAITDTNGAPNTVSESASNGSSVGITASASDSDLTDSVSFSLSNNAGGRFQINGSTGQVTVANAALLNAEAPNGTSHDITVVATSTDASTSTFTYSIAVTDDTSEFSVSNVTDSDGAANAVSESAANGDSVGITASASDGDLSDSVSYSLVGDAGGRFEIDGTTGEVTVDNAGLLDAETAQSHEITVLATSTDGSTETSTFTITVQDDTSEDAAGPLTDTDGAAGGSVLENAASDTTVGITANGPDTDLSDTVTYSLTDDAGGRFKIDANSGVVTVDNGGLLDHETDTSHDITVLATSTDGSTDTSTFTITVGDIANEIVIGPVSDSNAATNTVSESAGNNSAVGITALAVDPDVADSVTYSLLNNAGGRFQIDGTTGVVTVANSGLLDAETDTSHDITVLATSTDTSTSQATFTISVEDDDSEDSASPVSDTNGAANSVSESAGAGVAVGVTALSTDSDLSDSITYSLTNDAGGRFDIDENSGVVTTTGAGLDAETATSHEIEVLATSTDGSSASSTFTIAVTDDDSEHGVSGVSDDDGSANSIAEDATVDDTVGITALATDNDISDSVTYTLTNNAGGRFKIDANSGVIAVASAALLDFETATSHDVAVLATSTDGSTSTATFTIQVTDVNEAPFVDQGIGDQSADEDVGFTFTLPADAFDDVDAGDSLSFEATELGESGLPAWLSFNDTTQTFEGTPDAGDVGTITIQVTVTDNGLATASTTFDLTVDPAFSGPITEDGTAGPDTIEVSGSSIAHIINGLGGGDTLTGSQAGDTISGGAGDDEIMGEAGDDLIYGGLGNDDMTGGAGRDSFIWQAGEGGAGGKNAGLDISETITDFTVQIGGGTENDVLDLSGLLAGAAANPDHVQFISENSAGTAATDTRIEVDFDGHSGLFDTDFTPGLEITLVDVDLYATFGVAVGQHQTLADDMVANGNLIV